MRDGVDVHQGDDPRVVNLNARDRVINDQAAPLRIDRRRLLENCEHALDQPDAPVGLGRRQAEAAPSCRGPRADVPELDDVLGRAAELIAAREDGPDGLADRAVVWVSTPAASLLSQSGQTIALCSQAVSISCRSSGERAPTKRVDERRRYPS